ncbi:MAG: serine/threonine-protein phosphatase [Chloroflexi bacterium]|nr:serine/threonine-protein phosphatase [Chloroflexota bacterium]
MSQILLGSDSNPGGRKYNEDRCATTNIVTSGGRKLAVAVVCDGVGGEARGERAAQLAIDTFFSAIRRSLGDDDKMETIRLLGNALKEANYAVFAEATRLDLGERMACTMVAAAVENGERLFIANAGDSRIYLSHKGKLAQLTRDHTFANVMVWTGKMSAEAAAANPDANRVMRVLGIKDSIQVDNGIYLDTTDYGAANELGRDGILLELGDSVLLCTDGLIKKTFATNQRLVTDEEIVRLLNTQEGDKAARSIMSIALGRIPVGEEVDNITLAILQTEDPSRSLNEANFQQQVVQTHQRDQGRRAILVALAVAVPMGFLLIVALALLFFGYTFFTGITAGTATSLAQATGVAFAQTQTVAAFTPTPEPTSTLPPTAVPTAVSGEIAKVFRGDSQLDIVTDEKRQLIVAPPSETRYVAVTYLRYNAPEITADGNIYLQGNTQLQFEVVTEKLIQLTLLTGSDIVVQTGPYSRGAEIRLANLPVTVAIRGCMGLAFVTDNSFTATCFDGECGISTQIGAESIHFDKSTQLQIEIDKPSPTTGSPIPSNDFAKYWTLLSQNGVGKEDIKACGITNVAATQSAAATFQSNAAKTARAAITPTLEATPLPAAADIATTAPPTDTLPAPTLDATAACAALQLAGTPCP